MSIKLTAMLSVLSKLGPRAFNRKSDKQRKTNEDVTRSAGGESLTTKPCTCRVILLDDTELSLNVKVRRNI